MTAFDGSPNGVGGTSTSPRPSPRVALVRFVVEVLREAAPERTEADLMDTSGMLGAAIEPRFDEPPTGVEVAKSGCGAAAKPQVSQ